MFGNHGLGGLLEERAHEKSPKCLGGNLGDFGEFCKGLRLQIGSRSLVRRVKLLLRQIILACDNPKYPDMTIEGEDLNRLKVIGRVRYIGRRV